MIENVPTVSRRYAWVVFALSFGLMLSDYMSRQVLNAVFPLLKEEWTLTDAQLGSLSGVVALMVGLLTFPLSLLADRWGRVRSLTIMAGLWSLATLVCSLSQSYEQMFFARLAVGVGEAAYGSVGIAVVLSVFPQHLRATVTSAFMAGGMFGSVLGMGLGGVIAEVFGWRHAFSAMAVFGLVLSVVYPLVVRESRLGTANPQMAAHQQSDQQGLRPLASLYASKSILYTYVGSGLQILISGALLAWMPSFMNRYYGMGPEKAGYVAAALVLLSGTGMIVCGMLSDRLSRVNPDRKVQLAVLYCLASAICLWAGLIQSPGASQLACIGMAMAIAGGTNGPACAMVAKLTHPAIHATAFATLTLANNLIGLAPGPLLIGALADRHGLLTALQVLPVVAIAAAAVFACAFRSYKSDCDLVTNKSTGKCAVAL